MTSFELPSETAKLVGTTNANVTAASPQPATTTNSPKMLTNFSIDSIMSSASSSTTMLVDQQTSIKGQLSNSTPIDKHQLDSSASFMTTTTTTTTTTPASKFRPKNYQCPACKMAFSNNGQLKNHVRIHTGERPFKCNFANCNKTFTRNEELTRHKLIHTGVRPHSCSACGKKFGRKDHLKKHARTHERKRLKRRCHSAYLAKVSATASASTLSPTTIGLNAACQQSQTRAPVSQPSSATNTTCPLSFNTQPIITAAASDRAAPLINVPPIFQPNCIASQQGQYSMFLDEVSSRLNTKITPLPVTMANLKSTSDLNNFMMNPSGNQFMHHPANLTHPALQSPTANIQQLASEYWNKWYNLLGFYQLQQQTYPTRPTPVQPPPQPRSASSGLAGLGAPIKRP